MIDANVLISIMLSPRGVPGSILDHAVAGAFRVLVSERTLEEVVESWRRKPYLTQRVSPQQAEGFVAAIRNGYTILTPIEPPIARYTRDPRDDYLIAHAIAEEVDTLVSGDRDLLALDGAFPFRILTPAAFVAALDQESGTSD
ncbi:MAG: putative toxin-antitoxin system toxin component, PIN family [Thermomicrobiales bacterium]